MSTTNLHHQFSFQNISPRPIKPTPQWYRCGARNGKHGLVHVPVIKSDVINNNKALDKHPLFGGYMDHHCNFTNKYESATPECSAIDSAHF
jgi:hypothetical protein